MSVHAKVLILLAFVSLCAGGCRSTSTRLLPEVIKGGQAERISFSTQPSTAYHEAAHAVFFRALFSNAPESLRVFTEKNVLNYLGLLTQGEVPVRSDPAFYAWAQAMIALSGSLAEKRLYGIKPPTDDQDSTKAATQLLARCAIVPCHCPTDARVGRECLMDKRIASELDRLRPRVMACIEGNLEVIMQLAETVMRKADNNGARELTKTELDRFFKRHAVNTAACAYDGF